MFCKKCGRELPEGTRFCTFCGAPLEDGAAPASDIPTIKEIPITEEPILNNPKRKRGLGLMAAAAVLVVVIVAAGALLLGGLFSSPGGAVGKAAAKSLGAYASAAKELNLTGFLKPVQDRECSQSLSLELKDIQDSSLQMLAGGGIRASSGVSVKKKALDFSTTVFFGSADLLTVQMDLDNDLLRLYSPELMDNTALGLRTTTLGKDLEALGADMDDLDELSFNLFDLLEALEPQKPDPAAWKAFKNAIEVEKKGKTSMDINGKKTDCAQYHVVISKDAMRDYIDALEDAQKEQDTVEKVMAVLEDTGLPQEALREIEDELETIMDSGEAFDNLKEIVREIGDVELEVYLSGGYVSAVEWEGRIDDVRFQATLCLGGGEKYVDDLSLEIELEGGRITLESSGNHGGKKGALTDETELRVRAGGETVFTLSSELSYQPDRSSDNFSWTVKSSERGFQSLQMEGSLQTEKDAISLELEKCRVNAYDNEVLDLELSWSAGPYKAAPVEASKTLEAGQASKSELEDLEDDMEKNAERWVEKLVDRVPELRYMLYYMLPRSF